MTTKSLILFLITLGLAYSGAFFFPCINQSNGRTFDIKSLDTTTQRTSPITGLKIGGALVFNAELMFTVCKNTAKPVECEKEDDASSYIKYKAQEADTDFKCIAVTPTEGDNQVKFATKIVESGTKASEYTYQMTSEPKTGATNAFILNFNIKCNKDKNDPSKAPFTTVLDKMNLNVNFQSSLGCGVGVDDILLFMKSYKWIFVPSLIFIGLVLCLWGNKLFKYTLMMCGFLIGLSLVLGVCYLFNALDNLEEKKKIVILVVALLVGILGAYLFYKFETITVVAACGIMFFFIVRGVFTFFLSSWDIDQKYKLMIEIAGGLIGALLGYYLKRFWLIVSTSIGGSAVMVSSLGLIDGIIPEYTPGDKVPTKIYIFGSCWILFSLVGMVYQCVKRDKDQEEQEDWKNRGSAGLSKPFKENDDEQFDWN